MPERRIDTRNKTFLGARVVFNRRSSTYDCLIRNISKGGARLSFSHPVVIPSEFELTINQTGTSHFVQMVWRQELEAGIIFVDKPAGTVHSLTDARRITALEAERAALRHRIAALTEGI